MMAPFAESGVHAAGNGPAGLWQCADVVLGLTI